MAAWWHTFLQWYNFRKLFETSSFPPNDFDVFFLDIELRGSVSGYDFLRNQKSFEHPVVVVSSFPEKYGLEGYKYDIKAFLPKPIGPEELKDCLLRLHDEGCAQAPASGKFALDSGAKTYFLDLEEIIMFGSNGNYCNYYTAENPPSNILEDNSDYRIRITMKELETALPEKQFRRISKAYIVNTDYVHLLTKSKLELRYKNTSGRTETHEMEFTDERLKKGFFSAMKGLFSKKG